MEQWLEWARGPVFRACFAIMLLGLARAVVLNTASAVSLIYDSRKKGRAVSWGPVVTATLQWMFPVKKGFQARAVFSFTSMLFHVSIILTPIFLGAHILLWERGLGIRWPALGSVAADYLTLLAIFTELRSSRKGRRQRQSGHQPPAGLLPPLLIIVPFASGYLAMHRTSTRSANGTMFVHVMAGNLIFLLIPFTKMSHVALFLALS
jgi:hypothetical protein